MSGEGYDSTRNQGAGGASPLPPEPEQAAADAVEKAPITVTFDIASIEKMIANKEMLDAFFNKAQELSESGTPVEFRILQIATANSVDVTFETERAFAEHLFKHIRSNPDEFRALKVKHVKYGYLALDLTVDPPHVIAEFPTRYRKETRQYFPVPITAELPGAAFPWPALGNEQPTVRQQAVVELSHAEDPTTLPVLRITLHDPNWQVRQTAVRALQNLGESAAVEPLISALNDRSIKVRLTALDALAEIRDERAVHPLINVLHREKEDERLRRVAAQTLQQIGTPEAIEALRQAGFTPGKWPLE